MAARSNPAYASEAVGAFLVVVWSTIFSVHGKKTSPWTFGRNVTQRGNLKVDLCELRHARRRSG